jgi:hypothetical protein
VVSVKRILLLVTMALMLAAALALSGVALAKSPIGNKADAKCLAEASKTLQPGFNHADYNIVGGTEGSDDDVVFSDQATAGPDVFCGFGGDDRIFELGAGDIFLGGPGDDFAGAIRGGIFYGGPGNDTVSSNTGTFFGGEGFDAVRSGNDPVDGPEVP